MASTLDAFEAPRGFKASEYKPPEWIVGKDHLTLEVLEPMRVRVLNVMQVQRVSQEAEEVTPLFVLNRGSEMDIKTVLLNGTPLSEDSIRITDTHVLVMPPQGLTTFTLTTEVELNPKANKTAQGLFYSGDKGTLITQCEAESFRDITPFPDRPDMMPRWTLTLIASEADYPVLLANGNLTEASRDEAKGTHTATYENPFPTASYLVALAAGKFNLVEDAYTTKTGREVKLKIYVEPGREGQCGIAMAALKRAMLWEEEEWGVECDLDEYKILVVDEFNAGAMENKGFNIFATPNIAVTEQSYSDPYILQVIRIVAHEHGHNLRGNRIGVRDWTQIALKEGFTTRTDQAFMESIGGTERRITHVEQLRSNQFAQDAGAGAHAIIFEGYEGNPMESGKYNGTTYHKAAEVVRMLEVILGKEGFKKGVEEYIQFNGKAIVFEELLNVMAKANRKDLTQFKRWMHQVGTPEVVVKRHYDTDTQTLEITMTQACPRPPHDTLHLPIEMGLVGPEGQPVALELEGVGPEEQPDIARGVLHLKEPQQTFRFKNVPAGTVPSLLRGFSAPVKLKDDLSTDERRHLMQYDTDGFNRFESSRNVVLSALDGMIDDHANDRTRPLKVPEEVLEVFGEILKNSDKDRGISLKMLRLPDVNAVVQRMTTYDYELAHRALKALKTAIAERYKNELGALYERYADTRNQSMAEGREIRMDVFHKRGLRNLAMGYLAELGEAEMVRVVEQKNEALNMSDEEAAIEVLIKSPSQSDNALKEFFEKWKRDPVVLQKWIWFQARVEAPDLIQRLRDLTQTPGSFFDIKNPSHLTNLVLGFQLNLPFFHALQGEPGANTCEGYRFIVDLALTTPNAYWAGRMVEDLFRSYPKMDSIRRGLMEKELQRLLARPEVKPNVAERARKILGIHDASAE